MARTWRRCWCSRGPSAAVVVSGGPGSGKTTLGRELSKDMRLPHLNKDLVCSSLSRRFERALANKRALEDRSTVQPTVLAGGGVEAWSWT